MKNLPCPFARRASNPANVRSVGWPFAFAVSDARMGMRSSWRGCGTPRPTLKLSKNAGTVRDHLDDVPAIVQIGHPHDACGIGVASLDGVIDRDHRPPDGRGVTRPVQAEHQITGVLGSGHTSRKHRGAGKHQAKESCGSHRDRVRMTCCVGDDALFRKSHQLRVIAPVR